jgi:Fe-S-cluster containining protein
VQFNDERSEVRDARQEYDSLAKAIDDFVAEVTAAHPEHIKCRSGCFLCCVPPRSLFRIEGERIRDAVAGLPEDVRERIRARAEDDNRLLCPLLDNGLCTVYEKRPIVCRTQGMPLAVENGRNSFELDYCQLNFEKVPPGFELLRSHVLNLDGINQILAGVNLRLVQGEGLDPEEDGRVSFRKAAVGRLVGTPTPVGETETSPAQG